jgi:radical SAM superfamily enzyme YgiQ (UPF0313 family)
LTAVIIAQLPFPSTGEPDPHLARYYEDYERLFRTEFSGYFIPQDGLWEMPLWVAHLTALIDRAGLDSTFCDLSRSAVRKQTCAEQVLDVSAPGDIVLISPLAQNLDLALRVTELLEARARRVVIGGNMAPLVPAGTAHLVYHGRLDAALVGKLMRLAAEAGGQLVNTPTPSSARDRITWAPDYRHLYGYRGQVPLLRLNASHGCLYACSFCGDAWTRQLVLVEQDALSAEVDQLSELFPDTKLVYVGDKTFGQSKEAVRNLLAVFADRPGFRFIVQTHVMQVRPWVISAMKELGVVAAELGFESGDTQMLKRHNKLTRGLDDYTDKVQMISSAGIRVVLNVMGGLDEETEQSHEQTVRWLWENRSLLWLFNLYNFVPYPLVPDFPRLRDRIFDWDFAHWREDQPPVYTPRNLTPARSWQLFLDKVETAHRIVREALPEAQYERVLSRGASA